MSGLLIGLIVAGLTLAALVGWALRRRHRALRVLMYHRLTTDPTQTDFLTVSTDQFAQHLMWLRAAGFRPVTMAQVLAALPGAAGPPLPPRAVLLTFDDAYLDTLTLGLPLLRAHKWPATVFVPTAYIGGTNAWDPPAPGQMPVPLMTPDQLRALDPGILTIGLHSHRHQPFGRLTPAEVTTDTQTSIAALQGWGVPFAPALAYPYGSRPRSAEARRAQVDALAAAGVRAAFRIGNRLNILQLRAPYAIERLDIRGTDSLAAFRRKVRWGGKLG